MAADEGPTLRRRRLGLELKGCRERAGMTQEQVSRHFEWHSAKVTRIETARVAVTARDVKDMLALYGVEDDEYRDALMALARRSKERTWWMAYKDVLPAGTFIGLESEATAERVWAPTLVPGLLQTEAYMRALMRAGLPADDREGIDRRVELRLARQARLTAAVPLSFSAIADESVIRRVVGGRDVMREQLRRVLDLMRLRNVSFQLLPLDSGEHMFMGGPAVLLEFPEAAHMDVVYLEGLAGEGYEELPAEVSRYRREFDRLSARALSRRASAESIEKVLNE